MGTLFEISIITADNYWAENRVKIAIAEIKRIDKLLTTLRADSQINLINRSAGIAPVEISGELFQLINRSLQIAELTQGAFDITYGTSKSYSKVELNVNKSTVFLKEKTMRIYFGGIAKNYAIDRAKYILQMEGASNGVINADGILTAWGVQANGQDWTIGAADPEQDNKPYADFTIGNMAIASTANRNKANPGNIVCVMSTSAEFAGAMIAPLIHMGIKTGTEMVDNLQQVACIFVNEYNQMFASKYMNVLN